MKTGTAFCAIAGLLFISIVSLAPFWDASAQSGRVIPKPTPPPTVESPKEPEVREKFVADPNAEKYILIFARDIENKLLFKDPPKDKKEKRERKIAIELDALRLADDYQRSFIEQLKKAGEQGYKLISALGGPSIGIARLGEVQYEYTSIERGGDYFAANNLGFYGFDDEYAELSKEGFSLVDHSVMRESCQDLYDGSLTICESEDMFLFERITGVKTPLQFRYAQHLPSWSDFSGERSLTKLINDYQAAGFYPTHIISRFGILSHAATDNDKFSIDKAELQVVRGRKKINKFALQGYRLAVTYDGLAVMYRLRDPAPKVSYVWLDGWKKNIETELARLQERGAIYRMIDRNNGHNGFKLVFEQPAVDDGKRPEYRMLRFEIKHVENVEEQKEGYELTPLSKETMKTLNDLVKEGFEVRGLFYTDWYGNNRFGVLLERVTQ